MDDAGMKSMEKGEIEETESGTSIELFIADSGAIYVSSESGEGAEESEVQVKNLEEALGMVKRLAESAMEGGEDQKIEDRAYETEMGAPMASPVGSM